MANIFRTSNINTKTPRTTNRFTLRFESIQQIMTRARDLTAAGNAAGNRFSRLTAAAGGVGVISNNLELSLASVTIPSVEIEVADVYRFNDSVKHVTRFASMQDMTATFYDYIDGSASAIMQIWHGLVGDKETGAINFKSQYIAQAALYDFGPMTPSSTEDFPSDSSVERPLAQYAIRNVYPRSIELGDFSYESAEVRKITVQFACDGVYPVLYRTDSRTTTA